LARIGVGALTLVAYVFAADYGLGVPGASGIEATLDRHDLSVFRGVPRDDQIDAALRRARNEILTWVPSQRLNEGAFPGGVWWNVQLNSAVVRLDASSRETLARFFDTLFIPGQRIDGDLAYGDGLPDPDRAPAEPVFLTAIGLAGCLEHAEQLPTDLVEKLRADLQKTERMADVFRLTPFAGGWSEYRDEERPMADTYVTALALYALLEIRSSHETWLGSGAALDERLTATTGWLDREYQANSNPPGWPGLENQRVVDGLTLQIIALRLRAAEEARVPLPSQIERQLPAYLARCATRSADYPDQSRESMPMLAHSYEGRPQEVALTLSFPWRPWAIAAAHRWLLYARTSNAPRDQVVAVQRALGHVAIDQEQVSLSLSKSEHLWYTAEMLHGVSDMIDDK
jgi:hypothetical protein